MVKRAFAKRGSADRPLIIRIARSTVLGVAGGFGMAGLCVAVGLMRAAGFLLQGHKLPPLTSSDLDYFARLAIGFSLGGLVLGVCWPWIKRRFVRHMAFYIAGFVTATTLAGAERDLVGDAWRVALPLMLALGVIGGLMGVYYLEHKHPEQAGLRSRD